MGRSGAGADLILLLERRWEPSELERLRTLAPGYELVQAERASAGELARAVAIAGAIGPDELSRAPRLRWNHSWRAGVDAELFPELVESSVQLTSSAGNGAVPLAEHAMMLMLMLDRDAPRWMDAQRRRTWDRFTHGELAGSTVGIIGLGNAGRDLAQKAGAFHMRVLGLRAHPESPVDHVDRVYGPDGLHEMLAACDHVVVTAALTKTTRGMLDDAAFAAMRPGARLVNVSRGEIVDPEALRRALAEGRIAGAALDAHVEEPLPAASDWWSMPGVIVTPHNGATSHALHERSRQIFETNLSRFARGESLTGVVDKRQGY